MNNIDEIYEWLICCTPNLQFVETREQKEIEIKKVNRLDITFNVVKPPVPEILNNIKQLYLNFEVPSWLFSWVSHFKELEEICFYETGIKKIPEKLFNCNTLRALECIETSHDLLSNVNKLSLLSSLKVENHTLKVLPKELLTLENINILHLYTTELIETSIDFSKLTKLEELVLHVHEVGEIVMPILSNLTILKLNIRSYKKIESIDSIIDFSFLPHLKMLFLSKISFGMLKNFIESLPQLEMLSLSDMKQKQLPSELQKCIKLVELRVDDVLLEYLPNWICKLVNLEFIIIFNSNIQSLPSILKQLPKLKSVEVNVKHLSQIKRKEMKNDFGNEKFRLVLTEA